MPRGRKKATEVESLPVVVVSEEEGNIPFLVLEKDKYGIYADNYSYALVQRKEMNRTVKDEEGNPHHIEKYNSWVSIRWVGNYSLEDALRMFRNHRVKELDATVIKAEDIDALIENRQRVEDLITKAVRRKSTAELVIENTSIHKELAVMQKTIDKLNKTIEKMDLEIKKLQGARHNAK